MSSSRTALAASHAVEGSSLSARACPRFGPRRWGWRLLDLDDLFPRDALALVPCAPAAETEQPCTADALPVRVGEAHARESVCEEGRRRVDDGARNRRRGSWRRDGRTGSGSRTSWRYRTSRSSGGGDGGSPAVGLRRFGRCRGGDKVPTKREGEPKLPQTQPRVSQRMGRAFPRA